MDTIPSASDTTFQARREVMLTSARALHQPTVMAAGEYEDGTCAFCSVDATIALLGRYRDHLNGARTKVWMHDHPDSYPHCVTCAGFGYDMTYADWPCLTAVALGHDGEDYT